MVCGLGRCYTSPPLISQRGALCHPFIHKPCPLYLSSTSRFPMSSPRTHNCEILQYRKVEGPTPLPTILVLSQVSLDHCCSRRQDGAYTNAIPRNVEGLRYVSLTISRAQQLNINPILSKTWRHGHSSPHWRMFAAHSRRRAAVM